jgi:hypothetical protein
MKAKNGIQAAALGSLANSSFQWRLQRSEQRQMLVNKTPSN